MQSLTPIAILAGLSFYFIVLLYDELTSDLRKVPNAHFSAPFSRLWLWMVRWQSRENRTRLELHRRLGPVVRIAPRELSVACLEGGVQLIYGGNFPKNGWYQHAHYGNDRDFMFTMKTREEHAERKKMLAAMYTKSFTLSSSALEDYISVCVAHLLKAMAGWPEGELVDVLGPNRACMMDITSRYLYGATNGTDWVGDRDARNSFISAYAGTGANFFWRVEFQRLFHTLRRLGFPVISDKTRACLQTVRAWSIGMTTKAFDSHEKSPSTNTNVFGFLHDHFVRAYPNVSDEEAIEIESVELLDHAIASHDVGGITLSYVMYELSRHPEHQEKLRAEVRSLLQADVANKPLSQRIDELPVLDAIMMETLRLRSPSTGGKIRVVPPSGHRIADRYQIPGGTVVSTTNWVLHRNPQVFPSPDEWLPERWLNADAATTKEMKRWWWAFGSGARMCIGNHFGIRAMKSILVAIYTDYETVLLDDDPILQQRDANKSSPVGGKLELRLRRLTKPKS